MTGHGFRHMASTLLHERGYRSEWIERQLAHGDRNASARPLQLRGIPARAAHDDAGMGRLLGRTRQRCQSGEHQGREETPDRNTAAPSPRLIPEGEKPDTFTGLARRFSRRAHEGARHGKEAQASRQRTMNAWLHAPSAMERTRKFGRRLAERIPDAGLVQQGFTNGRYGSESERWRLREASALDAAIRQSRTALALLRRHSLALCPVTMRVPREGMA